MKNKWPELSYKKLKDTISTVQLWTQILGKIRLAQSPWINHSWHVTLYVSSRGLTTGLIPYGNGGFEIDMDFIDHQLNLISADGCKVIKLAPVTVAAFYHKIMDALAELNILVDIYPVPNEIEDAIPFGVDNVHHHYDAIEMHKFWSALIRINNVMNKFRAGFNGKCSPVHFFWGGFDLAVTRFSGRKAPEHPGGAPNIPTRVMQEAYSHEVSSCGFWPGSEIHPYPSFYSYCYPTPEKYKTLPVRPGSAFFHNELGEFLLKYEDVIAAEDPENTIFEFLQSTYEAAANSGNWDRSNLEGDYSELERDIII